MLLLFDAGSLARFFSSSYGVSIRHVYLVLPLYLLCIFIASVAMQRGISFTFTRCRSFVLYIVETFTRYNGQSYNYSRANRRLHQSKKRHEANQSFLHKGSSLRIAEN